MRAILLASMMLLAPKGTAPSESTLRSVIAEIAVEQTKTPDPRWNPQQRDCAGLVRFAYHEAFRRMEPSRLGDPLWIDAHGKPASFADAETLLQGSFVALGRGDEARRALKSGDVVAFRQGVRGSPDEWNDEPVFHLMIVVRDSDPARKTLVIYHPGAKDASVKAGVLEEMLADAPREWRPSPDNAAFLGFFRFSEFVREGETK